MENGGKSKNPCYTNVVKSIVTAKVTTETVPAADSVDEAAPGTYG
jgi:translation elongation factor P/translation initiation factor 5A